MRISDWSSDVCSSDLLPWRFQITVRGNVRHTRRCRRTRILGAGHQIFEQALAAALAAEAGFAIATEAARGIELVGGVVRQSPAESIGSSRVCTFRRT